MFDKAVSHPEKLKAAKDFAAICCEYAEIELRLGNPERARKVLERATTKPEGFDKRKVGKGKNVLAKRQAGEKTRFWGQRKSSRG